MFEKILIANRGEIVCRIIRTCKKLGVKTIVVFEGQDKNAGWYARQADKAYEIDNYMAGSSVIDAARKFGAGAIHPGYGFLSENPEFAASCAEAGIVFIGPSPDTIAMMGNKVKALDVAQRFGVRTLPRGKELSEDMSEEQLKAIAAEIGYPLMLKPSDGGGGIGMFVVNSKKDLFQSAERSKTISNILALQAIVGHPLFHEGKYTIEFLNNPEVWSALYEQACEEMVAVETEKRRQKIINRRLWENIGFLAE